MSLIGGILQGGKSSRMGVDKASVVVDGLTMRQRAQAALAPLCARVVQVGGAGADIDDVGGSAFAGVLALLRSGLGDRYLVCAVDMPLVDSALLQRLLREDAEGVAFASHPLPVCLRAARLPALEQLWTQQQLKLSALATVTLPLDDATKQKLVNVNTPEELQTLLRR